MFVLRSTLEKAVERAYEDASQDLSRLAIMYDERIAELRSQIADLRQLAFPPQSTRTISTEAREADAIISVSEKPPEMSEADRNAILEGQREIDRLLAGNYDETIQ